MTEFCLLIVVRQFLQRKLGCTPRTWSGGIKRHGSIPECDHGGLVSDLVLTHLTRGYFHFSQGTWHSCNQSHLLVTTSKLANR